jgi:hypothetical protein
MPVTINRRTACVAVLGLLAMPLPVCCQNPPPRLNEIVTANITGLPDEYEVDLSNCPVQDCEQWYEDLGPSVFDGEYPDWIEIHNPGDEPVNLEGYGLSDDPARPFKWTFPSVIVEPAGHLVVFASGKNKVETYIHTNFELNRSGEILVLSSPTGETCDFVLTSDVPIDMSMGRRAGAPSEWVWFDRPTPGVLNSGDPFPGFSGVVTATEPAGFYPGPIQVILQSTSPGAEVRFTQDGSKPDLNSELYAGPVQISATTVLRARGFLQGRMATPVATHTYLIGESPTFPVVSLSTDPEHLWDPDLGIYTAGRNARESQRIANYWQPWERPVHVEFFEPNGTRGFALDAALRIFGWGSRIQPQKSLAIMLRNRYGAAEVNYPLFPDLPLRRFSSLVLRAGGSDAISSGTFFRDPFASGLLADRNLDTQAHRPALVFINGVYFGIQDLREKLNEDYLTGHYDVDPDEVDITSRYWRRTYPVVSAGDPASYLELEAFLDTADLSAPETFQRLRQEIDIDSFLDYTAAQVWLANYDWPGNNNEVWRSRAPNSRWRPFLYDLDYTLAFALTQNPSSHNTLAHATRPDGTAWPNPSWTTFLIRKLLEVPEIRLRFINRIADLMNHEFLPARTEARLGTLTALYATEMSRHIVRWSGTGDVIPSMSAWSNNIENVRSFLKTRTPHVRSHVREFFNLPADLSLELKAEPPNAGRIKLNSLLVDSFPWTGTYLQGAPVAIDALPAPGFRFVGWDGLPDASDPAASRVALDPDRNRSIVARFEPSPGALNAVVIHEISYHAPEVDDPGDWVELHNGYALPVDISGWTLRDSEDNHGFVIPEGIVMEPGAFLVLCANLQAFTNRFPEVENAIGNLGFNLGNGGDQVRLFNGRKKLVDAVTYDDSDPWPQSSDGGGATLELIKPGFDRSVASNWRASHSPGGSPGAPNIDLFTAPLPLRIEAEHGADGLMFHLWTEPGRTYQIQASTDLSEWNDFRWVVGSGDVMRNHVSFGGAQGQFFRAKRIR